MPENDERKNDATHQHLPWAEIQIVFRTRHGCHFERSALEEVYVLKPVFLIYMRPDLHRPQSRDERARSDVPWRHREHERISAARFRPINEHAHCLAAESL